MGKIIWLASYPKSGNTWLRAFLFNYTNNDPDLEGSLKGLHSFAFGDMDARFYREQLGDAFESMSDIEIERSRAKIHAHIADTYAGNPAVKTHANFILEDGSPAMTADVTKCAIYVVRNPLDMIVSFADHYGASIDTVIEASMSANHHIGRTDKLVRQFLGSWSSHVANWISRPSFPRIVLRYEDMVRDPGRAFGQVVDYLKLERSDDRMTRALELSSFSSLAAREAEEGFAERSPNSERFFRSGKTGGWRSVLTDIQVGKIVGAHEAVMRKLGYLDEDNKVRF